MTDDTRPEPAAGHDRYAGGGADGSKLADDRPEPATGRDGRSTSRGTSTPARPSSSTSSTGACWRGKGGWPGSRWVHERGGVR